MLLKAANSLAQSQPAPAPHFLVEPDYQRMSVTVPRAVTLLADVASALFSHDDADKGKLQALLGRRRERSKTGNQNLTFTVPKNAVTRTLGLVA
ncbi:hypothetical protein [Hymenobacter rubidus]|uniref:hypothetical protein n=1 Tax=Hymenobacter rubidus TaxID=1441626 RepID=UPI00191FA873|nr:hypothetical protein [Hymenobacter rubidus]